MVKFRYMFLSTLTAIVFSASLARAFTAQQPGKAISYDIFARDNMTVSEKTDTAVSYNEIAGKILPKTAPDKIFVDLRHDSSETITAKAGQTFFLILPENENGVWHFNPKQLKVLNSARYENLRMFELQALCCGNEKIFMDYRPHKHSKITQSRILRLKVKK